MSADDAAPADQQCPACRGTGKVISNLGGTPSTVDCPWCEGSGTFMREHDAQARWKDAEASAGEAPAPPAA